MATRTKTKKKSKPQAEVLVADPLLSEWTQRWGNDPEDRWKVQFLKTFREHRNQGKAVVVCGIKRATVTRARRLDPAFDEACTDLWEDFVDELEESAMKRATKGSLRYHYDRNGDVTSVERKYETQLTIFMLGANRSKYKINVDGNTSLEEVVNKFHEITGRLRNTVPQNDPSRN